MFFFTKNALKVHFLDVFTKADAWQLRDWTIERENTTLVGMHTCIYLKSDNLQYNILGRWVDCLVKQVSDGPGIILID